MKVVTDTIKDVQLIEITTKYGGYRISEGKNEELDIMKIVPSGDGLSISPIVSNRITIK